MLARIRKSLLIAVTALFTVALAACGGGGGGGGIANGGACSVTNQKQFVLDATREWYLFLNLLPPTVTSRRLRDGPGLAGCADGDRARAGQGPVFQLPDDAVSRQLLLPGRTVHRIRFPVQRPG